MEKKKIILLVEDNRMDIELTIDAFSEINPGCYLQVASTGQKALDYVYGREKYQDRDAYPLPHLILLDLKMPGMNGHEVLKNIKSQPLLKRIPVIILTSSKEKEDLINCYEGWANSYVTKPVSFDDFLGLVKILSNYWLTLNIPAPMQ